MPTTLRPFPSDVLAIGEAELAAWDAVLDLARAKISEIEADGRSAAADDVDTDAALNPSGDLFVVAGFVFSSSQLFSAWQEAHRDR